MGPQFTAQELEIRISALVGALQNTNTRNLLSQPMGNLETSQVIFLQALEAETETILFTIKSSTLPDILETWKEEASKLLEKITPQTLLLLNSEELSQLIAFFKTIYFQPEGAATLSPQDRKRLVDEADARIHIEVIKNQEQTWKILLSNQLKTYYKNRFRLQNPEIFQAHEAAFEKSIDIFVTELTNSNRVSLLTEVDLTNLFIKIVTDQTAIYQKEYGAYERAATIQPTQTRIPLRKATTPEEKRKVRELEEFEKLLKSIQDELKTGKRVERGVYQLITGAAASVSDTEGIGLISLARQSSLAAITHRAVVGAQQKSQLLPNDILGIPEASQPLGGIIISPARFEKELIENNPGQTFTPTEVQRAYRTALRNIEQKINGQGGQIDLWQFNAIKEDLLETIKALEKKGVASEKVKRLLREAEYLDYATFAGTGLTQNRAFSVLPVNDKMGMDRVLVALNNQAVSRVIAEHQLLIASNGSLRGSELQRLEAELLALTSNQQLVNQLLLLTDPTRVALFQKYGKHYQSLKFQKVNVEQIIPDELSKNLPRARVVKKTLASTAADTVLGGILSLGTSPYINGNVPTNVPDGISTPVARQGGGLPFLPIGSGGLGRAAGTAAKTAARSMLSNPAVLAIITIFVVFVLSYFVTSANNSAFLPDTNKSLDSRGSKKHQLAAGTCPVPNPDPNFITDTLSSDPTNGHGSPAYWAMMEGRPGFQGKFSIPDGGIYSGCTTSACPYYGLAIDVDSATADLSVVAPYLCDKEIGCSDPEMEWNVFKRRGSEVLYLESFGNGRHWKIALIHVKETVEGKQYIARQPNEDGTNKSDVIGTYTTGGGIPHLHFEVVMDNTPIDPSPFCSGEKFVPPTPGGGKSNGQCSLPPAAHECSQLPTYWGAEKENASRICYREAPGGSTSININCATQDYSIGLFQINLLGRDKIMPSGLREVIEKNKPTNAPTNLHCWDAFNTETSQCEDVKQGYKQLLDACVTWLLDSDNNSEYAYLYQQNSGWNPWSTAQGCGL